MTLSTVNLCYSSKLKRLENAKKDWDYDLNPIESEITWQQIKEIKN